MRRAACTTSWRSMAPPPRPRTPPCASPPRRSPGSRRERSTISPTAAPTPATAAGTSSAPMPAEIATPALNSFPLRWLAISAGMGADHITIVSARADPAVVEVTQVNAGAGNDVVTILDATPRYLEVHGQTGNDTITLTQPASANPSFGGLTVFGDEDNDTITGGVQADVLVGGLGIDTIRGGAADDVIVGDHALILRDASYRVQRISTRDDQHGGDDHLFSSEGDDVVIGGAGAD